MVNFAQVVRDHWVHILVPLGFVVGCYLDRWNDEKMSAFRNKSLLYKRIIHMKKNPIKILKEKMAKYFQQAFVKDLRSLMPSEYLALRPIFVLLAMKEKS